MSKKESIERIPKETKEDLVEKDSLELLDLTKKALEEKFEESEKLWKQIEADPERRKILFQDPDVPLETKIFLGLLENEVKAPEGWKKGTDSLIPEWKKSLGGKGSIRISMTVLPGEGKKKLNVIMWGDYTVISAVRRISPLPHLYPPGPAHRKSLIEDFGGSLIVTIDQSGHPAYDPSAFLGALDTGQVDGVYVLADTLVETKGMGEYVEKESKGREIKKPAVILGQYSGHENQGDFIMERIFKETETKSKEKS